MSTARHRQLQADLEKQAEQLKHIGNHVVEGVVTHHDIYNLVEVIKQLTGSIEYLTRLDVIYNRKELP